jgi:hypothetical protein
MELFAVKYTRTPISGLAVQGEYHVGTFLSEEAAHKYLDDLVKKVDVIYSEIVVLNTPKQDPEEHVG